MTAIRAKTSPGCRCRRSPGSRSRSRSAGSTERTTAIGDLVLEPGAGARTRPPIAIATRTRLAATSPRVTSIPTLIPPPPPPSRSRGRALARPRARPRSAPASPTSAAPASRSWVTQTSVDPEPLAQLERASPRPRPWSRGRAPRSARRAAAPAARAPAPGRASPAAARRPRASGAVAIGEARVEAGEVEQPVDVRLAPGELGGEADVVGDRALQQRRQLRDQHDLAAQLERVALADVGAAVEDRARLGVGEPVEQPQHGRLARARGPGDAARAGGQPGAELAQHRLARRARG